MTQPTNETFESIRKWAVATFGEASPTITVSRAEEEMAELIEESLRYDEDCPSCLLEEAADVVITLANLPGLQEAVNDKMAKNRARQWKVMGDGTGYHVKEPS